jgi:hypothetical protein
MKEPRLTIKSTEPSRIGTAWTSANTVMTRAASPLSSASWIAARSMGAALSSMTREQALA